MVTVNWAIALSMAAGLAAWSFFDAARAILRPASDTSDFAAFWRAGRWVVGHHGTSSLYPISSFGGPPSRFVGPFIGFLNPPPVAVGFAPLGRLSLATAERVFLAGNLCALVVGSHLLWRWLRSNDTTGRERTLVLLGVFGCPALSATMVNGTMSLWILVALAATIWLDRNDDRWITGVAAAVLLGKPQYALLPLLFLFVRGRWKAVCATLLTTCMLVGVSLPLTATAWKDYAPFLSRYAAHGDLWGTTDGATWLPREMPNIRGLLFRAFGLGSSIRLVNIISALAFVVAAVATAFLAHRVRTADRSALPAWGAVGMLAVATAQHTNVADALLLVLPIVILAVDPARRVQMYLAFGVINATLLASSQPGHLPIAPWSALVVVGLTLWLTVNAIARPTPRGATDPNRRLWFGRRPESSARTHFEGRRG